MWTCVAYFSVAPDDAGTRPTCALFRRNDEFHVVRVMTSGVPNLYEGKDTTCFNRVQAARPKAVFINLYVSIGDITATATILERDTVTLPSIESDSPSASEEPS